MHSGSLNPLDNFDPTDSHCIEHTGPRTRMVRPGGLQRQDLQRPCVSKPLDGHPSHPDACHVYIPRYNPGSLPQEEVRPLPQLPFARHTVVSGSL